MAETADVVIVGGGSTGTAIAWQLTERRAGHVLLLEQGELGGGGTARSCAIVRTHYTHHELARLALRCQRFFENFDEIVGGPADYRRVGWLALLGGADREQVAANVAMQRRAGIQATFMSASDVQDAFPAMYVDDIGGAAYEPDSGYADPQLTTCSLAGAARRNGAEILCGVAAAKILKRPSGGYDVVSTNGDAWNADTVVVAAGARTVTLLQPLGIELPIVPVWHSIGVVRFEGNDAKTHPTISDRAAGNYYRTLDDHHALVGATAPLDGVEDWDFDTDHSPRPEAVNRQRDGFARRFPAWQPMSLVRSYAGVYDCTPDVQPLIGELDGHDGLFVAAGFSGHGFKLAPAIGTLLAQLIVDGKCDLTDARLFAPGRFADDRPIVPTHPYSVPTLG